MVYMMMTGCDLEQDRSEDSRYPRGSSDLNQLLNGTYREILKDDCRDFLE